MAGIGQTITIVVPSPAAGAEWSMTVPNGHVYEIQSIYMTFVTSAVVATRIPRLDLSDGTNMYAEIPISTTIAASLTKHYLLSNGNITSTGPGSTVSQGLPFLLLPAGFSITSLTTLIDVGDQWSLIFIRAIER